MLHRFSRLLATALSAKYPIAVLGEDRTLLGILDRASVLAQVAGDEEATRTQRLVNNEPAAIDDPLIVIGGTEDVREPDRYEARCRAHHRVAPPRSPGRSMGERVSVPIEIEEPARSA